MASKPSWAPLRLLSIIVLVVIGASTVTVAAVVRSVMADQQERLLHDRAIEAGAVVTTLFSSSQTTLPLLAATTRPAPGSAGAFLGVAEPMRQQIGAIGALMVGTDRITSITVAGAGPAAGTEVTGERAALVQRAVARKSASGVITEAGARQLVFAVHAGGGLVVYQDIPLALFADYKSGPDDAFNELNGILYASAQEDPSAIVLRTGGTGTRPHAVKEKLQVGADTWLLVAWSKGPLVGPLAADLPWLVFAAGILTTLLVTGLIETLARRRAYALALVDEKTLALRDALETQAELERNERAARQAAEAANRSKSEFLSRMSHELRTPLNAVLGFGQLLELDPLTEPQRESVEQIVKGGRHLLELINEVLDISRIETGTLPMSPEPVPVADVVNDTLTLLRPLAEHRDVAFLGESQWCDGLHVLADRQRLKQILLNLVANAIKYNRHGGTIEVTAAAVDGRVRIAVADTGIGLRSEDLDRLFVPFERLGAERSEVEGTGVGLALSRRLAEAMAGTIEVTSTHGEGSVFTVDLPVAENPLDALTPAFAGEHDDEGDEDAAGAASTARRTILCIEDNISNIRLIERVLEKRRGVGVMPSMQGRLGLALAREHQPAMILLDLHLPDLDGEAVLRELKADPQTASIPVVVVSADATAGQVERLLAAGATAYLTKPLDVAEFLSTVEALVLSPQAAGRA